MNNFVWIYFLIKLNFFGIIIKFNSYVFKNVNKRYFKSIVCERIIVWYCDEVV